MSPDVLHVVGERFEGFARENPEVITLAKLERMRLREGLPGDMTLIVLNPLDATYHAFGFPLGMDIEYHGMSRKESKGGSLTCEAKVLFIQGGELLTEVRVRYAVYDAAFLSSREATKARQALARATPLMSKTG